MAARLRRALAQRFGRYLPGVRDIGPLVGADETFNHQIVDTFGTVAEADRAWTEKAYATASAKDGSLQVVLGLGKYVNRGMIDAFAGISRGVEQWTVRAARPLAADRDSLRVGPIHYEIDEPMQAVTFRLEPDDRWPIAFEWRFEGALPPSLEEREVHRSPDGGRRDADIVRFHHLGTASGWVDVEGEHREIDPATWVSARDRSWGVRYQVGAPVEDTIPPHDRSGVSTLVMWAPVLCERPDGSRYGLFWYYQRHAVGRFDRVEMQGGVEHPDGRREPFVGLAPELRFRDDNRRLLGGTLRFTAADGSHRPIHVIPVSDTGFHLGAGLYFGYDGQWHGQWHPKLHVESDYVGDCSEPAQARRLHQMRSTVVRVDDPVGGGTGYGEVQSLALGAHPDMGLTAEPSFL